MATRVVKLGEAKPGRASRFGLDTAIFFLLFYLYVWLVVDLRLIHHTIGIVTPYHPFSFTAGWPFLWEHLVLSGGVVVYAMRFLTALYSVGWLGALVVTAAAWVACLGIDLLARRGGRSRGMVVRYGPAVLVLLMYGGNGYPLKAVLSLLAALLCFALYRRWAASRGAVKAAIGLLVVCFVAYHVGGAGSLLFAVLVVIDELLIVRRSLVALAALLCGLALPWLVGMRMSGLPFAEAYGGCLIPDPREITTWTWRYALVFYLYFPAVLAGIGLLRLVLSRRSSREFAATSSETGSPWAARIRYFLSWGESRWSMQVAAVCLSAGAIVWFTYDTQGKSGLEMDYYCQREMWPEVLEAADRMPRGLYNIRCNRNAMLALYHTGRLNDEMFRYPQGPDDVVYELYTVDRQPHTHIQESRFFLEIGQVNLAQSYAYEALVMTGDLPWLLKHLAVIHVVKDEPETARMLLSALKKKPLHCRAADRMLARLEEDPRLESAAKVRRLRRLMARKDIVSYIPDNEEWLLGILEENPDNKMAFEFLMAHYLRTGRPDKVVENLERSQRFEYGKIPRHFEEAILLLASATGEQFSSADRQLSSETVTRAAMFSKIMAGASSREDAKQQAVEAGLGDSYFFYFTFGESGL